MKFADCQLGGKNRILSRIGDAAVRGNFSKGWKSVNSDPTALAVETTWRLRIEELSIYKTAR